MEPGFARIEFYGFGEGLKGVFHFSGELLFRANAVLMHGLERGSGKRSSSGIKLDRFWGSVAESLADWSGELRYGERDLVFARNIDLRGADGIAAHRVHRFY